MLVHAVNGLQDMEFVCVLKVPELQAWHTRFVVAVGEPVCRLPAWQTVNAEHFRSEVAVAGVDSYSVVGLQTVSDRH